MPILNLSPDEIRRFHKGAYQGGLIYGYIGILQSDGTYIAPKRSDNMIAVTLEDTSTTYAVMTGINSIVGGKRVSMREIGNRLVIVSADTNGDLPDRSTDIAPTTIRGTGAEQIVETLLINEGLVRQQANSLEVVVFPVTYANTDGYLSRKTTYDFVDLTSSVPGSAGQRRFAVVILDRSDGSISVVDGTAKVGTLTIADIEAAALLCKQHEIPLAFVELVNGDTTVYWDRIVDARQFAPSLTLPKKASVTTSTYTIGLHDTEVYVNYAGAVTITLASASNMQYARELLIKDVSGAAGSNNITINRAGSDTIDGGTSTVISTNYGRVRLSASSSTTWSIIG